MKLASSASRQLGVLDFGHAIGFAPLVNDLSAAGEHPVDEERLWWTIRACPARRPWVSERRQSGCPALQVQTDVRVAIQSFNSAPRIAAGHSSGSLAANLLFDEKEAMAQAQKKRMDERGRGFWMTNLCGTPSHSAEQWDALRLPPSRMHADLRNARLRRGGEAARPDGSRGLAATGVAHTTDRRRMNSPP